MDFMQLVQARYSFRGFEDRPVEREKLERILACAQLAPSAANRQPWRIHLVTGETVKEKLQAAYPRDWLKQAPVIVVFTGLAGSNWKRSDGLDYLMCDVTIIADYFILAATEEGLGSCYIAAFDERKVREALQLSGNEHPFLMTPLGYPLQGSTRERKRMRLEEIEVRWE